MIKPRVWNRFLPGSDWKEYDAGVRWVSATNADLDGDGAGTARLAEPERSATACPGCRYSAASRVGVPAKSDGERGDVAINWEGIERYLGSAASRTAVVRGGAPASDHYTALSPEPIDVIEAWGLGFRLANAIKYIARAGRKDPAKTIEDLDKAIAYLKRERNAINGTPGW